MSLLVKAVHGDSLTPIPGAEIGFGQELQLHTGKTIVQDKLGIILSGVKYYNGEIMPAYVEIPSTANYTYTGTTIVPTWTNYDESLMTMSGDISATNAGTYETIFTLNDPDLQWTDYTSAPKHIFWTIYRKSYPIPYTDVVPYTGEEQSPTWYNYDPTAMTIGGTTAATEIGTYIATFTLSNLNYQWDDNTTEVKNIEWKISNKWYKINFIGTDTWQFTSDVPNPDVTLYDGVYQSNNEYNLPRGGQIRHWKTQITFRGYENFKIYIRSYAGTNDYVVAGLIDVTTNPNPLKCQAKTQGKQTAGTSITDYIEVVYPNPDLNTTHSFIIDFRRNSTGAVQNLDKGYLLIKRDSDA